MRSLIWKEKRVSKSQQESKDKSVIVFFFKRWTWALEQITDNWEYNKCVVMSNFIGVCFWSATTDVKFIFQRSLKSCVWMCRGHVLAVGVLLWMFNHRNLLTHPPLHRANRTSCQDAFWVVKFWDLCDQCQDVCVWCVCVLGGSIWPHFEVRCWDYTTEHFRRHFQLLRVCVYIPAL